MTKRESEAIAKFSCSKCGARVGEFCRGTDISTEKPIHRRRLRKLGPTGPHKKGSVRTISGGAFDSNRRRH